MELIEKVEIKKDLIALVRQFSEQIKNGRTIQNVHTYLCDEVTELGIEIYTDEPGEDGIAGEAIDVIICALDLIFLSKTEWTDQDIVEYAQKKCSKWSRKYS
jgi:hypothetical protein